jgi:hypothetical protein
MTEKQKDVLQALLAKRMCCESDARQCLSIWRRSGMNLQHSSGKMVSSNHGVSLWPAKNSMSFCRTAGKNCTVRICRLIQTVIRPKLHYSLFKEPGNKSRNTEYQCGFNLKRWGLPDGYKIPELGMTWKHQTAAT